MSPNIVPWGSSHLPRAVEAQLTRSEQLALIAASNVRAIDFVARVGLQAVADLSDLEGRLVTQCPAGEARLKAVADTAAGAIASEVAWMVQS